jgi:WD40 repeat protein
MISHGKVRVSTFDSLLQCASSLVVSRNNLFVVIDFEFGVSRTYRIVYSDGIPTGFRFVNDFSMKLVPRSIVSDSFWVAATASVNTLVIWEIFGGTIHRVVEFDEKITNIAFDECFGVWVATVTHIFFVSVNGDVIASSSIDQEVSALASFQMHHSHCARLAVGGSTSGGVWLLEPNFACRVVEFKRLPSEHRAQVCGIVIHPGNKMFVTVDEDGKCFVWSGIGVGGEGLAVEMYRACNVCGGAPEAVCQSCLGGVCRRCCPEGKCLLCLGLGALFQ